MHPKMMMKGDHDLDADADDRAPMKAAAKRMMKKRKGGMMRKSKADCK